MATTERPLSVPATESLKKVVEKSDLDPRLLRLLTEMETKRDQGEFIPAGTNDAILRAIRSGLSKVDTTNMARYRYADIRREQDDLLLQVLPDIRIASRRVAFKWPSITTEEDMTQILSVHFLERGGSLEKLAQLPKDKRLARLVAIGNDLSSGMRDDLDIFSGNFTYSVDEVRNLLENGALSDQVEAYDAAVGDLEVALGDIVEGNPEYAAALSRKYVQGISPERRTAEAKVLERAVDSLTKHMNRVSKSSRYEYRNGGRYRNNRQAINQIDQDYDGDAGRFDG